MISRNFLLISSFSLLAFLALFVVKDRADINTTADIAGTVNEEKEFSVPIDVVWRGRIISTMADGSCIGLEGRFDNYSKSIACLLDTDDNKLWNYSGDVKISGKWTGISCAYKETIFGECVPEVEIENIK